MCRSSWREPLGRASAAWRKWSEPMSHVNLYNAEGYLDPTAYEALTRIEREAKKTAFRPLVFISSPFAGDTRRNTKRARGFCRFAVSKNCIPVAPHLLFPQFMEEDDPAQRDLGIFFGMVLMSKCQEVWVFGRDITKGMAVEIEKAKRRGLPVRYFSDRCVEVLAP
nr:MAG TPA: deoxyribosyltransferase [Caudoviricetes sp.]